VCFWGLVGERFRWRSSGPGFWFSASMSVRLTRSQTECGLLGH